MAAVQAEAEGAKPGGVPVRKVVGALVLVALLECALTVCMISALQAQVPRRMPFGVTGPSPVVTAAESAKLSGFRVSFVNTLYANRAAATRAINQGKIYGVYITGTKSDELLTVPAKSFGGSTSIEELFAGAAAKQHRQLAVTQVKPLPAGKDPYGAVTELLLLPALVGGLLAAILIFQLTSAAAQEWRVGLLIGYGLVAALLTDLIAGPAIGAYAGDRFWPLLLCFWLVNATVALVTALLLTAFRAIIAMLLALLVFIVLGFPASGAGGAALLPTYWQSIGAALPPHYAASLFNNVLYFSSNNITTPIVVLLVYALIAAVVLGYLGWVTPRMGTTRAERAKSGAPVVHGSLSAKIVIGAFLVAAVQTCLFATNYLTSSHNPVAHDLPFGVVGNSPLTSAVQKSMSLKIKRYPDEGAAKRAIQEAKVYGALIPGASANTLLVVPTASDLAPYDLAVHFEKAAKTTGQKLTVTSYAPQPLPAGDTSGIVLSLLLVPLLVGGYMSATMLRAATGAPTQRFRGMVLFGFAVVAGLLVNLIAGPWLDSYPTSKFWIVWPILVLIGMTVALFTVVMHRLIGAAGTLVTVTVIILFGKPASGGSLGVPYLPDFWRTIGPFLPPRNALVLLRNTIYFDGNGIAQALIVLLVYLVVFAVIVGVLDWYRRPAPELPVTRDMEAEAAAAATPAGAAT